MKKLKMTVLAIVASVSLFSFQTPSEAASTTHTVSTGESLWTVANRYGVSTVDLTAANKQTSNLIFVGQKLVIPNSFISAADKDLIERLVSAEAKGESYAGKVAVATVILNRLSHPDFPNTVRALAFRGQGKGSVYVYNPNTSTSKWIFSREVTTTIGNHRFAK